MSEEELKMKIDVFFAFAKEKKLMRIKSFGDKDNNTEQNSIFLLTKKNTKNFILLLGRIS